MKVILILLTTAAFHIDAFGKNSLTVKVYEEYICPTPQDSMLNVLDTIDLQRFIGLPVDSILNAIPQGYINLKIRQGHSDPNMRASYLLVTYPNCFSVYIYVRDFMFMNPIDPQGMWDVSLFKKEKTSAIKFYYCADPVKYDRSVRDY